MRNHVTVRHSGTYKETVFLSKELDANLFLQIFFLLVYVAIDVNDAGNLE